MFETHQKLQWMQIQSQYLEFIVFIGHILKIQFPVRMENGSYKYTTKTVYKNAVAGKNTSAWGGF